MERINEREKKLKVCDPQKVWDFYTFMDPRTFIYTHVSRRLFLRLDADSISKVSRGVEEDGIPPRVAGGSASVEREREQREGKDQVGRRCKRETRCWEINREQDGGGEDRRALLGQAKTQEERLDVGKDNEKDAGGGGVESSWARRRKRI